MMCRRERAGKPDAGSAGERGKGTPIVTAAVDWPMLKSRFVVVRKEWDVAILANLREDVGTRPSVVIELINAQAGLWPDARRLTWKVMCERLRYLESVDYVRRQEMPGGRETRYWLLPAGGRVLAALGILTAWCHEHFGDA